MNIRYLDAIKPLVADCDRTDIEASISAQPKPIH
jgi:hypothetical protein